MEIVFSSVSIYYLLLDQVSLSCPMIRISYVINPLEQLMNRRIYCCYHIYHQIYPKVSVPCNLIRPKCKGTFRSRFSTLTKHHQGPQRRSIIHVFPLKIRATMVSVIKNIIHLYNQTSVLCLKWDLFSSC